MKTRVVALVVLLLLLGSAQLAHGWPASQSIVTGRVGWTQFSACEHPLHPGLFLQYYVTIGCYKVFLYGKLSNNMVGSTIWAQGTFANGSCPVLDISSFYLCQAPVP